MMEGERTPLPQAGGSASGRGLFLWAVTVGAGILAVGVYQVPQPWRGWLIGWLLFMFTLGILVLRFVRHYYQYKMVQLTQQGSNAANQPLRHAKPVPRVENLKIVVLENTKGGRHILR
jgi:uncharacterized membrane protein